MIGKHKAKRPCTQYIMWRENRMSGVQSVHSICLTQRDKDDSQSCSVWISWSVCLDAPARFSRRFFLILHRACGFMVKGLSNHRPFLSQRLNSEGLWDLSVCWTEGMHCWPCFYSEHYYFASSFLKDRLGAVFFNYWQWALVSCEVNLMSCH